MRYPAIFTRDDADGGFIVTFRDIPEANTQGDTYEEALFMAKDALLVSMDFYFEDNRPVPPPSEDQIGDVIIELSHH